MAMATTSLIELRRASGALASSNFASSGNPPKILLRQSGVELTLLPRSSVLWKSRFSPSGSGSGPRPRSQTLCTLGDHLHSSSSSNFSRIGRPTMPYIAPGKWEGSDFFLAPQEIQELRSGTAWADSRLRIFSGTANQQLAQEIACHMGLDLGKIKIKRFADEEIYVQLQESVRGCDVFLVQPTCPPANENIMELLIMIDACRRASAKTITAVIPYFGYARADRKTQGRESIAAKVVANMITIAGANRVLACDLHSAQTMGYFDIPVDHVYGQPVILDYLASKMISADDLVVVSPDGGGVARARAFAKKLSDAPLAIVDKRRQRHNVAEVMNLIGDVEGKVAVMVDDMIDTAGTITQGAALLHKEGAKEVYACCTHAVFSPPAVQRLSGGLFQEVIVTNTIPVKEQNYFPQLTVLSVANLLGETIWRVYGDSSVSSIFR